MAAPEVVLEGGSDSRARVQDPGLLALWHVITLGIYNWFWYYRINRELRDFGRARGDEQLAKTSPGLSLLAVTLGVLLIVPPFVSWWKCTVRVQRAQEQSGGQPVSGWLIGILCGFGVFTGFAWLAIPSIIQDHLNRIWKQLPAAGEGMSDAGIASSSPAPAGGAPLDAPPPNPSDRR